MANLRRVERTQELDSAFGKAKPKVLELRKLERSESFLNSHVYMTRGLHPQALHALYPPTILILQEC